MKTRPKFSPENSNIDNSFIIAIPRILMFLYFIRVVIVTSTYSPYQTGARVHPYKSLANKDGLKIHEPEIVVSRRS